MAKKVTEKKSMGSEKVTPTEKVEYKSTPTGMIKCIVLKPYEGMSEAMFDGDIIELPERRFKSLAFRGFVKEYDGEKRATMKR